MGSSIIQSTGYDIFIGESSNQELNAFLQKPQFSNSRLFALVDEFTAEHCLPIVSSFVDRFKEIQVLKIESGEASKNIEVCTYLWKTLGEMGADRQSLLINLGGGVIGDMGGFVASTFKRGIPFVNVPTTLLSQVDASIGGKVGVDLDHLKNEIGLFSSPKAVFIYPDFLKTLSRREMMSGFAEVIKHALIADASYWDFVFNANVADGAVWQNMIEHSIRIKNNIVQADPHEKGLRKALNFGHTIGHAIESFFLESPSQSLLHGEAVAIGMIMEAYLSHLKTGLSRKDLKSISDFIMERFGYQELQPMADHRLLELMRHDKKNAGGGLNFTLLKAIGSCEVNCTVDTFMIKEALKFYRDYQSWS